MQTSLLVLDIVQSVVAEALQPGRQTGGNQCRQYNCCWGRTALPSASGRVLVVQATAASVGVPMLEWRCVVCRPQLGLGKLHMLRGGC